MQMNKTEYLLYRSKRKTISVEISREAKIIVRAPLKMTVKDLEAFLNSKSEWINKHLLEVRKRIEEAPAPLSEDEKNKLKKRAKQFLSERVSYYAELMGVEYGSISIRAQKTRFGSCSTKKNLNFNLAIMLMPSHIVDYVIVHELAHLKEMNHSPRFWNEVGKIIPEYKKRRKWLSDNGVMYIQMI